MVRPRLARASWTVCGDDTSLRTRHLGIDVVSLPSRLYCYFLDRLVRHLSSCSYMTKKVEQHVSHLSADLVIYWTSALAG